VSSNALIRSVAVRVELHPMPLMVSGDRVQIQQILLNLTLNALEAMAESSTGERKLVLRSTRTATGQAQVDVEDTGSGLREGLREVVFQPFYSTKADGMGMGLAIARSIADAHGGRLWADGNEAGGTTFHFTLPLAP
jgi:two-component system sensor kinase FixL